MKGEFFIMWEIERKKKATKKQLQKRARSFSTWWLTFAPMMRKTLRYLSFKVTY
jgi:hypothetical protein